MMRKDLDARQQRLVDIEEALQTVVAAWTDRFEIKSSIVRDGHMDTVIGQARAVLKKGAV